MKREVYEIGYHLDTAEKLDMVHNGKFLKFLETPGDFSTLIRPDKYTALVVEVSRSAVARYLKIRIRYYSTDGGNSLIESIKVGESELPYRFSFVSDPGDVREGSMVFRDHDETRIDEYVEQKYPELVGVITIPSEESWENEVRGMHYAEYTDIVRSEAIYSLGDNNQVDNIIPHYSTVKGQLHVEAICRDRVLKVLSAGVKWINSIFANTEITMEEMK